MRDFLINSLEFLVGVFVGLMLLGVLFFASLMGSEQGSLAVLVGGTLYVILLGGMLYLGIGIYHNTKRTADLLDQKLN